MSIHNFGIGMVIVRATIYIECISDNSFMYFKIDSLHCHLFLHCCNYA